jgi:hypothetical protein
MNRPRPFHRRRVLLATALVAVFAIVAAVWKSGTLRQSAPSSAADVASGVPHEPALVPHEPALSLATLRQVIATGGCPLTREAAIAWLDQHARQRSPLPADAGTTLLGLLRDGRGHPDWTSGYRQHLFNSACNALRVNPSEESAKALASILHDHALTHPDRVLRLYALQHIDSLRKSGHLHSPLAEEIHATLLSLAASPESDVTGTVVHLLAEWDGPAAGAPPAILELAAHTAADRSRPVDIRVSAIHTAGPAALEAARAIAIDTSEPVILRKAAIARIGHDGGTSDLPTLQSLCAESFRLAQAAEPAIQRLQSRHQQAANPAPAPYQ